MSSRQREALKEIHHQLSLLFMKEIDIIVFGFRVKNIIKSALAKPLRNCEVGSYDEQFSRWEKHCESNGGQCFKCKFYTSCDLSAKCFAKWSQMAYESEVK
mgnify:CR=1 FL=1